MHKFFFIFLLMLSASCHTTVKKNTAQAKLFNNTELKIFPVAGGWGYSIDVNGSKFIRQEMVPVLQGSHPFATKVQAQKVGSWVAARIRHNEGFSLTLPILQNLMTSGNVED